MNKKLLLILLCITQLNGKLVVVNTNHKLAEIQMVLFEAKQDSLVPGLENEMRILYNSAPASDQEYKISAPLVGNDNDSVVITSIPQ